jgi:hypothetical protein
MIGRYLSCDCQNMNDLKIVDEDVAFAVAGGDAEVGFACFDQRREGQVEACGLVRSPRGTSTQRICDHATQLAERAVPPLESMSKS